MHPNVVPQAEADHGMRLETRVVAARTQAHQEAMMMHLRVMAQTLTLVVANAHTAASDLHALL